MHWTHKPQKNAENISDLTDSSQTLAMEYLNTRFSFPSRTLFCPILGILTCLLLMVSITKWTILLWAIWNGAIGQAIYWLYSRKNSILGNEPRTDAETIDPTNACGNYLTRGQQQQQRSRDVTTVTTITQAITDNRATVQTHERIITLRL